MADKLYFGVKGIIIRNDAMLLLYSHVDGKKLWDFPGGRMTHGEDAETTLIREIKEETGMTVSPRYLIDTWNYVRDKDFHVTGVFYYCETDHEEVDISSEHDGYEWIPIADLYRRIHNSVYMPRLRCWNMQKQSTGYEISACRPQFMNIDQLVPNNHYLNEEKLSAIRTCYEKQEETYLPPVLITKLDGEYLLLDGHARAFVAFENGDVQIETIEVELPQPEGFYQQLHMINHADGILHVQDLAKRILSPSAYKKKWEGFCKALLQTME